MKQSGEFFNVRIANSKVIDRDIETFDGMPLIRVPKNRFYNTCTISATDGYSIPGGSKALNFVIADKNAICAVKKYENPKIVSPANNNDADAYIYGYRTYHDLFVPDNKTDGIYIHAESSTT
jgi:hypothetical protein